MSRRQPSSSNNPAPASGAGLIRFYQDASNGIKVSPIATLVFTGILILVVILAKLEIVEKLL